MALFFRQKELKKCTLNHNKDTAPMHDNTLKANGALLKKVRIGLGLSATDVAKKLGSTSRNFVYNIEDGKIALPAKMAKKMSVVYDIPEESLINLYAAYKFEQYKGRVS